MTMLGRLVLDGLLFGLIPRDQDCAGWDLPRMPMTGEEMLTDLGVWSRAV